MQNCLSLQPPVTRERWRMRSAGTFMTSVFLFVVQMRWLNLPWQPRMQSMQTKPIMLMSMCMQNRFKCESEVNPSLKEMDGKASCPCACRQYKGVEEQAKQSPKKSWFALAASEMFASVSKTHSCLTTAWLALNALKRLQELRSSWLPWWLFCFRHRWRHGSWGMVNDLQAWITKNMHWLLGLLLHIWSICGGSISGSNLTSSTDRVFVIEVSSLWEESFRQQLTPDSVTLCHAELLPMEASRKTRDGLAGGSGGSVSEARFT